MIAFWHVAMGMQDRLQHRSRRSIHSQKKRERRSRKPQGGTKKQNKKRKKNARRLSSMYVFNFKHTTTPHPKFPLHWWWWVYARHIFGADLRTEQGCTLRHVQDSRFPPLRDLDLSRQLYFRSSCIPGTRYVI